MSTDANNLDNDRRWADAQALLNDSPDEAARQRTRRRHKRMWLAVVAAAIVLPLLGVLAGFLFAASNDSAPDPSSDPLWVEITGFTCTVLGLVAIVTAVVRMYRAGQFKAAPTSALTRSQQKSLRRQVLGKDPVEPLRLPLLRHLALRITQLQSTFPLLYTGLMLQQVGGFIRSPGPWRAALLIGFGLLIVIASVEFRRNGRQAEQFLADHPDLR